MIVRLLNLTSRNDGTKKTVSVDAKEDETGGNETFDWVIINEQKTTTDSFQAREEKTTSVIHTATGKGLVKVTARSSGVQKTCSLDVDALEDHG